VNYKFDFVRRRKLFFTISGIITILGIISLFIFGMNLGIDFKSGSRVDIHIGKTFTEADVTKLLQQAQDQAKVKGIANVNLKTSSIRTAGNNNEISVARFDQTVPKEALPIIRSVFQAKYGTGVDIQESTVDPTIGKELARKAIYAVLWASLGIVLYVSFRFEYRFAIAAIIALLHDSFFVISMFSFLRFEVDITFIAAILTIVGYSVNDTIVIFDRIRDNMKKAKIKRIEDIEDIVNLSLNQTLSRSINTVLTVVIAALALFIFGGSGLHNFSLALLFGLFTGAYSSIFIASQIWVVWKEFDLKKKNVKVQQA